MDREVIALLRKQIHEDYELIENQSIRVVASYLSKMALVISNDTGIMHVSAAVGVPVLSLFGPTDPEQWAPMGGENRYIAGRGGRMESITVEEVLTVARTMLKGTRPG
jgi:heptosyltransferase-2